MSPADATLYLLAFTDVDDIFKARIDWFTANKARLAAELSWIAGIPYTDFVVGPQSLVWCCCHATDSLDCFKLLCILTLDGCICVLRFQLLYHTKLVCWADYTCAGKPGRSRGSSSLYNLTVSPWPLFVTADVLCYAGICRHHNRGQRYHDYLRCRAGHLHLFHPVRLTHCGIMDVVKYALLRQLMDRIYIHSVGTVQYLQILDPQGPSQPFQDFLLCYPCP